MDRDWSLVFYSHPTPPLYTAQLEFPPFNGSGAIIQVFAGTFDEGFDWLQFFCQANEISKDEAPNFINIVELMAGTYRLMNSLGLRLVEGGDDPMNTRLKRPR